MNPADMEGMVPAAPTIPGSAEVNRKRKVHVNTPPYIQAKQRRRSERAEERQAESAGERVP